MYWHDRFDALVHSSLHGLRVHVSGIRLNVHENRFGAAKFNSMRRCHMGHCRDYDLIAGTNSRRKKGKVQSGCTRGNADRMGGSNARGEGFLESPGNRAMYQGCAREHLGHGPDFALVQHR